MKEMTLQRSWSRSCVKSAKFYQGFTSVHAVLYFLAVFHVANSTRLIITALAYEIESNMFLLKHLTIKILGVISIFLKMCYNLSLGGNDHLLVAVFFDKILYQQIRFLLTNIFTATGGETSSNGQVKRNKHVGNNEPKHLTKLKNAVSMPVEIF